MDRRLGWMALAVGMIGVSWAETTHAALVINFGPNGSDVVAVATGSLQLNPLAISTGFTPSIYPSADVLLIGAAGGTYGRAQATLTGPASFGAGLNSYASSSSGSTVGFALLGGFIYLPSQYLAGTQLSGTDTFANQTIASLGLTAGTYTYTTHSVGSTLTDTIVVNVGTVPEPASACLMEIGLAGAGLVGWKHRRRAIA